MKTLTVGIATYEEMKQRTLAIARGEHKPGSAEPKVWFTSLESMAKVLSAHNQALLDLIAREQPQSLTELETLSGRAKSNLSRTLKTMERYGLVNLERGSKGTVVPKVPFERIRLDLAVVSSSGSRAPTRRAA